MCSHDDGRHVINSNERNAFWSPLLLWVYRHCRRNSQGPLRFKRWEIDVISLVGGAAKSQEERSRYREGWTLGALIALYFTYPKTSKTKTNEQLFQWTAFFSIYWLYYICFYSFFLTVNLFSVLVNTLLYYNFEKLQLFKCDLWILNLVLLYHPVYMSG